MACICGNRWKGPLDAASLFLILHVHISSRVRTALQRRGSNTPYGRKDRFQSLENVVMIFFRHHNRLSSPNVSRFALVLVLSFRCA